MMANNLASPATLSVVCDQLHKLRFEATQNDLETFIDKANKARLSPLETLYSVFRDELAAKQAKKVRLLLELARFPRVCTLDEYDFTEQPSIEPGMIRSLANLDWLARKQNILFQGPPGVGKTHLSIALGRLAAMHGQEVRFLNMLELMRKLARAATCGRTDIILKQLSRPQLLIIDEVDYFPVHKLATHLFFQLIALRYERGSIVMTSNRKLREWGEVFDDPQAVDAFLDRFLHHSEVIAIKGTSHRLRERNRHETMRDLETVLTQE